MADSNDYHSGCYFMYASAPPSPALSLSAVLHALRGEVGAWSVRGFLNHVLALVIFRRLGEICGQIERMMARFQAGRLWRRSSGARTGAKTGVRIWPSRFGWLVRAASYQAAGYGAQLRVVLEQPEMVELLKASPQAARILRPVCRMLAVEASLLRPGEVIPEPAPRVVKPRIRKAPPTPGAVSSPASPERQEYLARTIDKRRKFISGPAIDDAARVLLMRDAE